LPSRKTAFRVAIALAAAYLGTTIILLALEDRLLFHPVRADQHWSEPPPSCEFQDIYLRISDRTLIHSRWWPCKGASEAVLVCHSRSGNLSLALTSDAVIDWQREVGASVFIFDYPGYGRSEGYPSEAGCYAAADAAYEWLTESQHVSAGKVIIVGRSLGTAVAVDLASRKPHRALALISPFSSFPDAAQSHYPFLPARWFVHNRFDSLAKIGQCPGPVLIIHGTRDRTAPFQQGKRLFAAADEPKQFVAIERADHGDSVTMDFLPTLRRFLRDTATTVHEDK
jgi:pimeloyl-ACP methyl ester carboxylesterase